MIYDYNYLIKEVYDITNIDLSSYKEVQMKRRIDSLIRRCHIDGYDKYIEFIKNNSDGLKKFVEYITINVSEFYRNPEQWKILTDSIYPELFNRFGQKLKIWSAACSTGDEPYSLVMALSRHIPLRDIEVVATDISDEIIEKAKIGIYSDKSIANVPDDLLEKYFEKNGSYYKISEDIKKCVIFKKHNLLSDDFYKNNNLIVCRNVLIYFTEEVKSMMFEKFYESLVTGGFLFIGSTEQIMNYKQLGFIRKTSFFYEKTLIC